YNSKNNMMPVTNHDKFVINAIFNPNYPLDFDGVSQADTSVSSQIEKQVIELKLLEAEGVRLAEHNYLTEAIECFTRAIEINPQQPSPYNNRAQAFQLQNRTNEANVDLSTAIELASSDNSHQKVLCLALTQRGILNRFLGKNEASLEDFQRAAELGSPFAKQQVLLTNPYAAACNEMLAKMFKQASGAQ
ncbi:unnamed protein product, partial [Rotaria socialis]